MSWSKKLFVSGENYLPTELTITIKSGKAAKNLPTLSRAELSPRSFYSQSINLFINVKLKDTYMTMTIQDNLLEMLQVRIVNEGSEIGAVRRRN